jgi:hypothetical protein
MGLSLKKAFTPPKAIVKPIQDLGKKVGISGVSIQTPLGGGNSAVNAPAKQVGNAVGAKNVTVATPLGGSNSTANQVANQVKNIASTVGSIPGALPGGLGNFSIGDLFGAQGYGGLLDKIFAREDKAKQEAAAEPKMTFGLTGSESQGMADRYSDNASQAAISNRYNAMAQLARGQQGAQNTSEQTALSRRLASTGALNSGAGMKMLSQQQQAASKRAGDQNLQMQVAQSGERQGATENLQKMNETARQFDSEFALNTEIAKKNMEIADKIAKANSQGLMGSLFSSIFGEGAGGKNFADPLMSKILGGK